MAAPAPAPGPGGASKAAPTGANPPEGGVPAKAVSATLSASVARNDAPIAAKTVEKLPAGTFDGAVPEEVK